MFAIDLPGTELQLVWQDAHVPVPTVEYEYTTVLLHEEDPAIDILPDEHDAQIEEPEMAE